MTTMLGMTNNESIQRMVMAATKRARMARMMVTARGCRSTKRVRAARAMALVTRVACDKEGDGDSGKSDGNEGGGRAMAARAWQQRRQTTINQQLD
jgi:hypothetical protein